MRRILVLLPFLAACGAATGLHEGEEAAPRATTEPPGPAAGSTSSPKVVPPKLAPACTVPKEDFTADPSFGFVPGTDLELYFDERYGGTGPAPTWVFLRLVFRRPTTPGRDAYGPNRHRLKTTMTLDLETPWPTIPAGDYEADLRVDEEDELCYPDGLGYGTPVDTPSYPRAKLHVREQGKAIAGTIDVPAAGRIDFRTTVRFADGPELYPRCCTE